MDGCQPSRLLKIGGFSVPEGRDDGSLARSAWEQARQDPSRRVQYDRVTLLSRNQGAYSLNKPQFDSHPLTPCPTGRTHDLAVPGTSCQATIISSLRDTTAFALGFFNSRLG